MFRRAILLLAVAGIYVMMKRKSQEHADRSDAHDAEARWASEGGANSPATI